MEHGDRLELERAGAGRPAPLSPAVRYLVWGLIALGVLLRLRLYFFSPALWLDEASLLSDLLNTTSLREQIQAGHTQLCPLGFLVLTNAAIRALGTSEYVLRLVPLFCSLAALVPFYFLARRCMGPVGLVVAVCLFAVAPKAVRYAAELKPYSMDLAASAALAYLGVVALKRRLDLKWAALLAGVGAAAAWFSFPAAFVLAGFGTVLFAAALLRGQWGRALALSGVGAVWVASIGLYFLLALKAASGSPKLQSFWESSFMPLPPTSLADLRWFATNALDLMNDPGGLSVASLGILAYIVGFVSLVRRDRDLALALAAPIVVTLLVSGLKMYPFSTRLLLFSLPFIYLPVAEGAQQVRAWTRGRWKVVGLLFVLALVGPTFVRTLYHSARPEEKEAIRPVLAYVAENRREGDVFYICRPAFPAYRYYAPRYGLDKFAVIRGIYAGHDWAEYREDVQQLKGRGRVWIIFSHYRDDERKAVLGYLDELGSRLSDVQAQGSAAYLYGMRPAPEAGPSGP